MLFFRPMHHLIFYITWYIPLNNRSICHSIILMKPNKIVGRKEEQLILSKVLGNKEAQLVAVYGRRRIGKTFLIKSFFADKIKSINLIGSKRLKNKDLLSHFRDSIVTSGLVNTELPTPNNWNDAFKLLRLVLETNSEPIVIFIDEVPWFDRPTSSFIGEFEHFWNSYATNRENLKIILCGSATSWMLKKLIYNHINSIIFKSHYIKMFLNNANKFFVLLGLFFHQLI